MFWLTQAPFDGLDNESAKVAISDYLEKEGWGKTTIQYRLRDWLISRQRYWGTPIPIVYCDQCGTVPVPKEQLPVLLPEDVEFDGKRNPLTTSESFLHTECPNCGKAARRETDTMDTFVDSSWYFLRFVDPRNSKIPFEPTEAKNWLPIDEYVGGIEHAVLHLLYSRFFTKVLYDEGMLSVEEPFESLLAQGMVLKDGEKMSKSKGNVVSPMEIINKYGADTARLFILFAAPPERDLDWSDTGVEGSYRFLHRVWRLVEQHQALFQHHQPSKLEVEANTATKTLNRLIHTTIRKVTHEIGERNHFNTAISSIMELVNGISNLQNEAAPETIRDAIQNLILLIAPFVPHIAEELWHKIGHSESVHLQAWPSYDEEALIMDEVEIVVQVNGKVRTKIHVPTSADPKEIENQALRTRKDPNLSSRQKYS